MTIFFLNAMINIQIYYIDILKKTIQNKGVFYMPQLRPQGKYVYGWSIVRDDNTLILPFDVMKEYGLEEHSDIILFSSSKTSGGFCISKLKTLRDSKLSSILMNNPELEDENKLNTIINYKGKSFCHIKVVGKKKINLSEKILKHFGIMKGNRLLIVRGSNIAFDCLLKGPLIEVAKETDKKIDVY